jgi:hypothetical protein
MFKGHTSKEEEIVKRADQLEQKLLSIVNQDENNFVKFNAIIYLLNDFFVAEILNGKMDLRAVQRSLEEATKQMPEGSRTGQVVLNMFKYTQYSNSDRGCTIKSIDNYKFWPEQRMAIRASGCMFVFDKRQFLKLFALPMSLIPLALFYARYRYIAHSILNTAPTDGNFILRNGKTHQIECDTLDNIISSHRADVMKIDIEGAEIMAVDSIPSCSSSDSTWLTSFPGL